MTTRTEEFFIYLTNLEGVRIGSLDDVDSGKISLSDSALVSGTGTLTWNVLDTNVDWSSTRVSVEAVVSGEVTPLGTYVVTAPSGDFDGTAHVKSLQLTDKTSLLRDNVISTTVAFPAGSNLVESARHLITETGETNLLVIDSTLVTSQPQSWPPGTSYLEIVNDLLANAGYRNVYANRWGQLCLTPWASLSSTVPTFSFSEGEDSTYLQRWSYGTSLWDVSNKVILTSQEVGGVVFTSVRENLDATSPSSIPRLGRVVNPVVKEGLDVTSQAQLDLLATKYLEENSIPSEEISIDHLLNNVWVGDSVSFSGRGVNVRGVVQKMDISLVPGNLVGSTLKVHDGFLGI